MHNELDHIWSGIQAELRRAVPESTFSIWLEPLRLHSHELGTALILAPDDTERWVTARYARVLQTSVAAVLGPETTVEILRESEARKRAGPPSTAGRSGAGFAATGLATPDTINPKHTFDQFVIGTTNRMAHAAALAVAEQPGQAYNPLFVYGPPGMGKTHLLHSIANYIREHGDGLIVRCATVEEFTNAFVGALQHGAVEDFKRRFRHTDVLLIDDVQFLESKAKTEEEFFHTFNALYESGAQLVLTSDRLPRDMGALEARLRERFEAGLVTDIQPPDFSTRLTILRKRAVHDAVDVAEPAALELIADRIPDNIRSLEGALIRVVAFSSLKRRPVDTDLVAEVLDSLVPPSRSPRRSVHDIQQATCEAFDLSLEELVSDSRASRVVWPRQVAMYLARELTDSTLPTIGRQFGGRNHTTVMHALKRTGDRISKDPDAYDQIQALTTRLRSAGDDRPG